MIVKFDHRYRPVCKGFDGQNTTVQIGKILSDQLGHLRDLNTTDHLIFSRTLGLNWKNVQSACFVHADV